MLVLGFLLELGLEFFFYCSVYEFCFRYEIVEVIR